MLVASIGRPVTLAPVSKEIVIDTINKTIKKFYVNADEIKEEVNVVCSEEVTEAEKLPMSNNMAIRLKENNGIWYSSIEIRSMVNNSKIDILKVNLNNYDNYQLSGLISTYLQYVNYYNRMLDVANYRPPAVDYLNTIHKDNVLKAIDKTELTLDAMRVEIITLGDEVISIIKNHIDNGNIVVGNKSLKSYLAMIFKIFKVRDNSDFEVKPIREKL